MAQVIQKRRCWKDWKVSGETKLIQCTKTPTDTEFGKQYKLLYSACRIYIYILYCCLPNGAFNISIYAKFTVVKLNARFFMHPLTLKMMFRLPQVLVFRNLVIVIVIVIFLGQLCPRGKGAMRLSLCKAPTHETRPDHNTGNYVPYSFR